MFIIRKIIFCPESGYIIRTIDQELGVKQLKRMKDPEVFSARFFHDRKRGFFEAMVKQVKIERLTLCPYLLNMAGLL